jgi:hypothetical protein
MLPIMHRLWLPTLAALAGCLDTPDETLLCTDLYPSECAQQAACKILSGYSVSEEDGCVDFTGGGVGSGCESDTRECVDESTLAAPPDDPSDCFLFTDSCVPTDWVSCEDVSDIPPAC